MTKINTQDLQFSDPLSPQMLEFEKEIAYFFGVQETQLVAQHYIQAVQLYEKLCTKCTDQEIQQQLLPHLIGAYTEIAKQLKRQFDIEKAANLEFDLFMVFNRCTSFEASCEILVNIYQTVFHTISPQIYKAAMLRTFLYQYKNEVFKQTGHLSDADREIMLSLAEASKSELVMYTLPT